MVSATSASPCSHSCVPATAIALRSHTYHTNGSLRLLKVAIKRRNNVNSDAIHSSPSRVPKALALVQWQKPAIFDTTIEEKKLAPLHNSQRFAAAELHYLSEDTKTHSSLSMKEYYSENSSTSDFKDLLNGSVASYMQQLSSLRTREEKMVSNSMFLCEEKLPESFVNLLFQPMAAELLPLALKELELYGLGHDELALKDMIANFKHNLKAKHLLERHDTLLLLETFTKGVSIEDLSKSNVVVAGEAMKFSYKDNNFALDDIGFKTNKFWIMPENNRITQQSEVIDIEANSATESTSYQNLHRDNVLETITQPEMKATSSSIVENKVKSPTKKKKKRSQEQDLLNRNSFQHYEHLLTVLFDKEVRMSSILEKKSSREGLMTALNQIAATVAGGGLGIMMVVASKMLSSKTGFDSKKLMNILFGFGLIWLSNGIQNLKNVVSSLQEMNDNVKSKRKKNMGMVKREINNIAIKAFTLAALSVVRFA